ncbi:hypothetical protein [Scytonema sp. NUACC21]
MSPQFHLAKGVSFLPRIQSGSALGGFPDLKRLRSYTPPTGLLAGIAKNFFFSSAPYNMPHALPGGLLNCLGQWIEDLFCIRTYNIAFYLRLSLVTLLSFLVKVFL